jgi:ribosome-binding protein aMBF1 (putative translation factor)
MAKANSGQPRITRSSEDKARHRAIRARFREEPTLSDLVAAGEIDASTYERASRLRQSGPPVDPDTLTALGGALREARERAGLSLADVTQRSGIDAPALSRLENGQNPNPTLATLSRYAHALGKRLFWSLEG